MNYKKMLIEIVPFSISSNKYLEHKTTEKDKDHLVPLLWRVWYDMVGIEPTTSCLALSI